MTTRLITIPVDLDHCELGQETQYAIEIPREFLARLGWEVGDEIVVAIVEHTLVLTKNTTIK
jgi:uncharacterized membrane protein (UPF0127 family)